LYQRHFADPRRERALLGAASFTAAFATARGITHAIRAGVGPFGNVSAGGRHIHHSTFGIVGLLGLGDIWLNQYAIGTNVRRRTASRVSACVYGVASALTLDEFALWLDLQDDYWDKQGRKSIDAVAIFGGVLSMAAAGRGALREIALARRIGPRRAARVERARSATCGAVERLRLVS
jgi:hypothetical protein